RFGNYRQLSRCLQLKGTILAEQGQLSAALNSYHRAIDLARQVSLSHHAPAAYMGLGSLYLKLSDPESALNYLQQAVALKKRMGTFQFGCPELVHIAICYRKLGKIKQAERAFDVLLALASTNGDLF